MNKASKAGTQSKPVKKTAKAAAKPAKKRSKPLSAAAKAVRGLPKLKIDFVPLAEVEVVAAAAIKKIKASRKLSPDEKAFRLADVADSLEKARTRWGGLSHAGVYMIRNAHEPSGWCDLEAVLA
jgi:hypothetical protein